MTSKRIAWLVALMVAVGWIRVTQQTALRLQAYALGHQQVQVHRVDTDTRWLHAQVVGLESPARLAKVMKDRHETFVAQTRAGAALASATSATAAGDTAARSE